MIAVPAAWFVACDGGEECSCPAGATTTATGGGGSGGESGGTCDVNNCESCRASECARDQCTKEVEACDADSNCAGFDTCIESCGPAADPDACVQECLTKFPGGQDLLGDVWLCQVCDTKACYLDCGGADICAQEPPGQGGGVPGVTTGTGPAGSGPAGSGGAGTGGAGTGGAGTGGAGGAVPSTTAAAGGACGQGG